MIAAAAAHASSTPEWRIAVVCALGGIGGWLGMRWILTHLRRKRGR